MNVYVPSQLQSYTGKTVVSASGETLEQVLHDLDSRYPGLRFRIVTEQDRIRDHIRVFVNRVQVFDLSMSLRPSDEVRIVGALSGG